eukprot:Colp12_sorted_trinity150504_noHs@3448
METLKREREDDTFYDAPNAKRLNGVGAGVSYQQGSMTDFVEVPDRLVGRVIGAKGIIYQSIVQESGCNINIPQENEPGKNVRLVKLVGTPTSVDTAKRLITKRITDATGNYLEPLDPAAQAKKPTFTFQVTVADRVSGKLIGKKGETFRQISDVTKAKIYLPPTAAPGALTREVSVAGDFSDVLHAMRLIQRIVNPFCEPDPAYQQKAYLFSQQVEVAAKILGYGMPNANSAMLHIPNMVVGSVIGKAGATIRSIKEQSGAEINLSHDSPPGTDFKEMEIRGTPMQVSLAERLVIDAIPHNPIVPTYNPRSTPAAY